MNIIDVGLTFGSMNMNNHPSMLIVHHLEAEGINWTVDMIHQMHINERGWAGIGYHFYIRLDGSVYRGRPPEAIGAHCQGCNLNTLGIAFEGDYGKRTEMPSAQFNAWCELKKYLTTIYGNLPVYGHREKGSSECPGRYFPLDEVKTVGQKDRTKLGWNQNNVGWWYCTDVQNGYFYENCWKLIDGEWFSFDDQGYAKSNQWEKYNEKWYYLRADCSMALSQWLWIDGECYCFDKDGVMYENCTTPDGYKVDETGSWVH